LRCRRRRPGSDIGVPTRAMNRIDRRARGASVLAANAILLEAALPFLGFGRFPAIMFYNPYRTLTAVKGEYSDAEYNGSVGWTEPVCRARLRHRVFRRMRHRQLGRLDPGGVRTSGTVRRLRHVYWIECGQVPRRESGGIALPRSQR